MANPVGQLIEVRALILKVLKLEHWVSILLPSPKTLLLIPSSIMVNITASHKFTFNFQLALPEAIGKTPSGNRVFLNVTSGTVTGSNLSAEGVHGGDWAIAGDDGWGRLDVRSVVKTKENELIYITYQGHLEMTPAVMKGEKSGESRFEIQIHQEILGLGLLGPRTLLN